jgi:hypothetical protein
MISFLKKLRDDERATLFIEFAYTFPIFLLLIMGGYEVFRLLLLERKINLTASSVANLIAQNQVLPKEGISNIFDAVDNILTPFELKDNGQVFVSYVHARRSKNSIELQCKALNGGGYKSKLGSQKGKAQLDVLPGNFTLTDGENVVITEVYLKYEPFFYDFSNILETSMLSARDLYTISAQSPRFGEVIFTTGCP